MRIQDRRAAGRLLAHVVSRQDLHDPVVVGLGPGGLAVGAEVAAALGCPLDILDVEEFDGGDPLHPARTVGAVSSGGHLLVRPDGLDRAAEQEALRRAAARATRIASVRAGSVSRTGPPSVAWRTLILVDDGTSSRQAIAAAIDLVRAGRPGRVILAIPIAPQEKVDELNRIAGEVLVGAVARYIDWFRWHGHPYEDETVPDDEQIGRLLAVQ